MSRKHQATPEPKSLDPIVISPGSWAMIVIAAMASYVFHFNFGGINHSHLLPLINYYQDPTTYQYDYINPCYEAFLSYFWYAIAFVGKVVSVKGLLLTMDAIWCVLTAWSLYCLSYRLFTSTTAARLAVLMLVLTKPSPAGIFISLHGSTDPFSHTNFVLPFLLIALRWALEYKWLRAWAMIGLLANIHVVSAAFFACMFGAMMLVNRPREWWRCVAGPILLVVLAIPLILRVVTAVAPDQITTPDQIERLKFIYSYRMPYHRFPSSWQAHIWLPAMIWAGFGALGWLRCDRTQRHKMMLAAFCVLVAILGWLYIVVEVWNVSVAMMVFPFGRSGRFAVMIALLYAGRWMADLLDSDDPADRFSGLCAATWGIVTYTTLNAAAIIPLIGLIPDISRSATGRKLFTGFAILVGVMLARTGPITPAALYNVAAGLFVLAAILMATRYAAAKSTPILMIVGLTITAVLAPLSIRLQTVIQQKVHGANMSLREAAAAAWKMPNPHWEEMQRWVDANLPRDAVLLTPFHFEGFRTYAKRSIVCEWKDPGIITCSHLPTLFEWDNRIRTVFGVTKQTDLARKQLIKLSNDQVYSQLSDQQLVAIARMYNAGYIVTETWISPPDLPLLHRNKRFQLFRLPPAQP